MRRAVDYTMVVLRTDNPDNATAFNRQTMAGTCIQSSDTGFFFHLSSQRSISLRRPLGLPLQALHQVHHSLLGGEQGRAVAWIAEQKSI
eukprot:2659808-Amphidinium_carterae.2